MRQSKEMTGPMMILVVFLTNNVLAHSVTPSKEEQVELMMSGIPFRDKQKEMNEYLKY
jgi:hypothetical protein